MTEPMEDSLNGALRTLVADLMADRPSALLTFETWCHEQSDDIMLMTLVREPV